MLVTQLLVPQSKWGLKCPYNMTPEGITIHNTANDASAMSEISYMIGNGNEVSYHFAIDDYRVVQGVLENRNTWQSGDGAGFGNRRTLGIEICYSKSGGERFDKAEINAAEFIAQLMVKYGWGLDKIYDNRNSIGTHQNRNNKYCPHRTLDKGLDRFYDMVRAEYRKMTGQEPVVPVPPVPSTGRNVGDVVTINGIYTSSSSTQRLNPAKTSGTITRIIPGARNPYLLDGGNLGWVNDSVIIGGGSQPTPTKKSVDEVAREILYSPNYGGWGTGQERRNKLQSEGYNADEVQARINQIVNGGSQPAPSRKSVDQIAREILYSPNYGGWGTGQTRKNNLAAAGYDYNEVQARINQLA